MRWFRAVGAASGDALLLIERGLVRDANGCAATSFRDETGAGLIGRSVEELAAPGEEARVRALFGEANKDPVRLQCRRLDDSYFYGEMWATTLEEEGLALLTIRDLSKQLRLEEALQSSERQLRAMLDSAFELIGLLRADGTVADVNRTALLTFGVERSDVVGRPMWEVYAPYLSPEDAARLRDMVEQAGRGELARGEMRARAHEREAVFDVTLTPMSDVSGHVFGIVAEGRDVTDRVRAEAVLLSTARRLEALTESAIDAIVTAEEKGVIIEWNRGAQRVFGWTKEEAIGRSLEMIMPDRYIDAHRAGMRRLNETGQTRVIGHVVELNGRRASGEEFPVELALSQWKFDGKTYYTGILRDITERHEAAEAIQRANAELRSRNRELQEFAYVASHDLQEPLRKINSFLDLLITEYGDRLEPEAHTYVERVQSASMRAATLIRDLLSFSRVSTVSEPYVEVDLNLVLDDVLSTLEASIGEGRARVTVEPLPTIEASASQIYQLFQNLLGNALKYHRPGELPEVVIRGEIEKQRNGPPLCRIEVEDRGIGFDEKYLDRIFKPFQRLHARDEYVGTGMGLAICRRIVERHGGELTAHSEPGKGSTFVVTLPVRRREGTRPEENGS